MEVSHPIFAKASSAQLPASEKIGLSLAIQVRKTDEIFSDIEINNIDWLLLQSKLIVKGLESKL